MSVTKFQVRPGVYYDSVILMQLQKSLAGLPGVLDAGVVMATVANRELLDASGFDLTGVDAKADDLLIVVKADKEATATAAIAQVDELVQRRRSSTDSDFHPRSISGAVKHLPQARWVLVSVPGRFAAGVAEEVLDLGRHVFLYSDNVSVADEVRLKERAREEGLLLMGPDCGTAIINGVGFGFANRVRNGVIGLVGASGTGLQALTAGVHNLGGGVSQAIGTGGRDLKVEVGGSTTLQALDLLGRDPQTEVIVLVSKPIDPQVAAGIVAAAQACRKPVVLNLLGYPPPARQIGNLWFATTLQEAAELAVGLAQEPQEFVVAEARAAAAPYLRGLFSGGTLAYEALLGLQTFLAPLFSNIPLRPEQQLADSMVSEAHTILDLGEDEFTQGRLHPMMDNDLRVRRLRQEAADPEVGYILLDVVLGEGAHPDPASELAPAISAVKAQRDIEVLVIVLGTDEDPQDIDAQIARLSEAGCHIFRNTTAPVAALSERMRLPYRYESKPLPLADFEDGLVAINVGVESFYKSLDAQGVEAVQVEWRPPAGGKSDLMDILAKMKKM